MQQSLRNVLFLNRACVLFCVDFSLPFLMKTNGDAGFSLFDVVVELLIYVLLFSLRLLLRLYGVPV